MDLKFKLSKIKPKYALAFKFERLKHSIYVHRIFAAFDIFNQESEIIFETEGIIDTGATLSIFPGELFKELKVTAFETHTMWGIINKEECHIVVDITEVSIQLIDIDEKKSPIIKILAGFPRQIKVPTLIGMKSFLANFSYSFYSKSNDFIIKIPD